MVEISKQTRLEAVQLFNLITPIADKIRAKYPEAKFLVNDILQLTVYTNASNLLGPIETVEDDLLELSDKHGLQLQIIPANLADYEKNQ